MNLKSLILPVLGATLLAAFARYYFPKIETKTVTQTHTVVQTDVRTVTRIVERPDGTKETTTETVDHSTADKSKSKATSTAAVSNWHVSGAVERKIAPNEILVYSVQVERRILGPIYAGVRVDTVRTAGLVIGLEF